MSIIPRKFSAHVFRAVTRINGVLNTIAPISFLLLRAWVGWVFLNSGYLKISAWDSTVFLFENEFSVPLLPPLFAAYAATFVELLFSSMVILGFGARFGAFMLIIFNFVAVYSYPDLGAHGVRDHQIWGLMLSITLFYGAGHLSLDHGLKRYIEKALNNTLKN